jgi:hypothetical protein
MGTKKYMWHDVTWQKLDDPPWQPTNNNQPLWTMKKGDHYVISLITGTNKEVLTHLTGARTQIYRTQWRVGILMDTLRQEPGKVYISLHRVIIMTMMII